MEGRASIDRNGPLWLRGTFYIYRFRSMIENTEAETGAKISNEDAGAAENRVTGGAGVAVDASG